MADDLLGDLLRQVSRSFYLSLAILPRPLREPIGLAYLLARAADTVADTRLIVREDRVRHVETRRRPPCGARARPAPPRPRAAAAAAAGGGSGGRAGAPLGGRPRRRRQTRAGASRHA